MSFNPEAFSQFLSECDECIEHFENDLLDLEANPNNSQEILDSLYRTVHTVKGSSGLLQLNTITELTHKSENILSIAKENPSSINSSLIELFLKVGDELRLVLDHLKENQTDQDYDASLFLKDLDLVESELIEKFPKEEKKTEQIEDLSGFSEAQLKALKSLGAIKQEDAPAPVRQNSDKDQSIRVKLSTLDKLSAQVSELIANKEHLTENLDDYSGAMNILKQIDKKTTELRNTVIQARMQSLSAIENKLKRAVRDTAKELGKEVDFQLTGSSIKLDRAISEAISAPLVHIIRNSIDHGIEEPKLRRELEKPEKGQLKLHAQYDSVWISLTFSDDGRGISIDKIRDKAVEQGLVLEHEAFMMNDQEVLDLIFDAGFSTKDEVSTISGRGVGMDVVKSSINQINGQVEIKSEEGQGTQIKIKVPATLAIAKAVTVRTNGQNFAVPQNIVEEFSAISSRMVGFDLGKNNFFFKIGRQKVPLVFLHQFLEYLATGSIRKDIDQKKKYFKSRNLSVLFVNFEGYNYALAVDQVLNLRDIVVKPLDLNLDGSQYFTGATTFADSSSGLILDPRAIASVFAIKPQVIPDLHEDTFIETIDSNKRPVLKFKHAGSEYLMPISYEHKFERVLRANIKATLAGDFIKSSNESVRLIDFKEIIGDQGYKPSFEFGEYVEVLNIKVSSGKGFCINLNVESQLEFFEDNELEALLDSGNYIDLIGFSQKIIGSYQEEASKPTKQEIKEQDFESIISFRQGEFLFGLKLEDVQEVIRQSKISKLNTTHNELEGLVNIRGDIMSSYKLSEILDCSKAPDIKALTQNEYVIVDNKEAKYALAVDSVNTIHKINSHLELQDLESVPEQILGYSNKLYNIGSDILAVLDARKLVEKFMQN